MVAKAVPQVAVVTGGHPYDVPRFHQFFRALDDVDCYIQHMDDFASSESEVRRTYDAVLFYHMLMDGPSDARTPSYAGKPETALAALGDTPQGLFFFHHAILAYPKWDPWSEMVGIADRTFDYHIGEHVRLEIAKADHPITRGLAPWEMTDETYTMADAGEGSEVLLTLAHPRSMKTVAWTRRFRKSRVFCLQGGHDAVAWADPTFAEVVRRGLLWCAGRL